MIKKTHQVDDSTQGKIRSSFQEADSASTPAAKRDNRISHQSKSYSEPSVFDNISRALSRSSSPSDYKIYYSENFSGDLSAVFHRNISLIYSSEYQDEMVEIVSDGFLNVIITRENQEFLSAAMGAIFAVRENSYEAYARLAIFLKNAYLNKFSHSEIRDNIKSDDLFKAFLKDLDNITVGATYGPPLNLSSGRDDGNRESALDRPRVRLPYRKASELPDPTKSHRAEVNRSTKLVQFRLTPEDIAELDQIAAKDGLSRAGWITQTVLTALEQHRNSPENEDDAPQP